MKIPIFHPRRVGPPTFAGIILLLAVFLAAFPQDARAQNTRERHLLLNDYVAPEELISMSKTLPFDKAVSLFNDFSKKYLNKLIVDPTNTKKEIGVDIENMYWLQAFETVLRANSLWYEEKEEYFQIYNPQDTAKGVAANGGGGGGGGGVMGRDSASKAMLLTRDIKISTVLFTLNLTKSLNTGINWTFKDSSKVNGSVYGGQLQSNLQNPDQSTTTSGSSSSTSGQSTQANNFLARIIPNLNFGNLTGFVSFLQENDLGDIISSPQLTVSSGKKGQIQVGSDIFVTTKDFAGNTIQQQIATGIIVSVTPTLYEEKGMKFINLAIHVEDSKQDGSNIDKDYIDTYLLLNDGEEAVMGGLYTTSQTSSRIGIPFLKDLPWYVFGLRYIFGSEQKQDIKNELIILLKAEVVPSIEERLANKMKTNENLIEKTRKEFDEDMAKRKVKSE
ncbi:MAG TPA: type II and III secretion system protein [Bacteroidota bacterium]|nr:type II and III secretion system protein [Bacteroidota bacterium]